MQDEPAKNIETLTTLSSHSNFGIFLMGIFLLDSDHWRCYSKKAAPHFLTYFSAPRPPFVLVFPAFFVFLNNIKQSF